MSTLTLDWLREQQRRINEAFGLPSALISAGPRFGGLRVLESLHAVEIIEATIWDEPKFSPHRSKRLWKKLRKRTARPHPHKPTMYMAGDTLFVHPALMPELRRRTVPAEPYRNSLFGF